MLFDAMGQPIAAPRPTPTPVVPADPHPDVPAPTPEEAAEIEAARDIAEVRVALRNAAVACAHGIKQGDTRVAVPAADLLALFKLAVASIDEFVERRMIDDNGVRVALPMTDAPMWEARVGELIGTVIETIRQSAAARSAIAVAPEGVLGQLPPDAAAALRTAQQHGLRG